MVRKMTELHRQIVCIENEKIIGAFVLNTDSQGAYENAAWSRNLRRGEYMVIHALAVDPYCTGEGIGGKW